MDMVTRAQLESDQSLSARNFISFDYLVSVAEAKPHRGRERCTVWMGNSPQTIV